MLGAQPFCQYNDTLSDKTFRYLILGPALRAWVHLILILQDLGRAFKSDVVAHYVLIGILTCLGVFMVVYFSVIFGALFGTSRATSKGTSI